MDASAVEAMIPALLRALGDDPERSGLVETPRRVAEACADLFSGYGIDAASILEVLPNEVAHGLIMVRDLRFVSICEHHLLPFIGTAALAYLPGADGRITGLSKLARVVEVLSRRLQVQERLVREIADAMETALSPRAVWVYIEAEHLCMSARGARKPGSVTVTTDVRGEWRADAAARTELLALARGT